MITYGFFKDGRLLCTFGYTTWFQMRTLALAWNRARGHVAYKVMIVK